MKKLILFLLIVFVSTNTFSQKNSKKVKVSLKKTERIKLSEKQIGVIKKTKTNLFFLKGAYLYPMKGKAFYVGKNPKGKNISFIMDLKEFGDGVSIYFDALPGSSKNLINYCSCGSNTIEVVGDYCKFYYDPSAGHNKCGGACEGDAEGQSCSVTTFDIDTGQIAQAVTM